jgi:hypothetical protein
VDPMMVEVVWRRCEHGGGAGAWHGPDGGQGGYQQGADVDLATIREAVSEVRRGTDDGGGGRGAGAWVAAK